MSYLLERYYSILFTSRLVFFSTDLLKFVFKWFIVEHIFVCPCPIVQYTCLKCQQVCLSYCPIFLQCYQFAIWPTLHSCLLSAQCELMRLQRLYHVPSLTVWTRKWINAQFKSSLHVLLGLKKNPVFRATRPYLSEPDDLRLFLRKIPFFPFGVFIIKVSILKKKKKKEQPTLPKVFKTVSLNTRIFFLPYMSSYLAWLSFHMWLPCSNIVQNCPVLIAENTINEQKPGFVLFELKLIYFLQLLN